MSKQKTVHLGFEVGTGEPVSLPMGHLVCFGQTQMAGKTTALEALISRAGVRAVAFVTKRGEGGFDGGNRMLPYFSERADWQYVQAVLEATLTSKMDYKQAWIMRACEGASTLAQVQRNTKRLMEKAKGLNLDMYYVLDHYFDIVVPQIAALPKTDEIELTDGLNVMDLEGYSPEMQALVIRSVIEWVHQHEEGVVTVIPEAWRFLPEGRRSPVSMAAEELIREGAALHNFVWCDSQDIAGIWKLPLRSAKAWLIGVQRETNEVKRNLDNIPAAFAKPKPKDVALLELGQFFGCFGKDVVKTYVQPAWMNEADARAIAMGDKSVNDVARTAKSVKSVVVKPSIQKEKERIVTESEARELREQNAELLRQLGELRRQQNGAATHKVATLPPPLEVGRFTLSEGTIPQGEEIYQFVKRRLMTESPSLVAVLLEQPEVTVTIDRPVVQADGSTLKGRVARLVHSGFYASSKTSGATRTEMKRTGPDVNSGNLSKELAWWVSKGFLTAESDGFLEVSGMRKNVKKD